MVDVYVGWFKGIEAVLPVLKAGGIDGVMTQNTNNIVKNIIAAGLKHNAHNPGPETLNLAADNYYSTFVDGSAGQRRKEIINQSIFLGQHVGYACTDVIKMDAAPNQPGGRMLPREELFDRLTRNIFRVAEIASLYWNPGIRIGLETLDRSRPDMQIPWDLQKADVVARRKGIEENIRTYGINAAIAHVTEPGFIKNVFTEVERTWGLCHGEQYTEEIFSPICPVGFIADIAHMFITADSLKTERKITSIDDYFDQMMTAVGNKTYEMHLTVPEGDPTKGYSDQHWWLKEGDTLSHDMIKFARRVKDVSPDLKLITLEMREHGKSPEEFADILVDQANLVKRELSI